MTKHNLAAVIIITLVVALNAYLARLRARVSDVSNEYRYPKFIIYALMGCFFLPALLIFAPDASVRYARDQFTVTAVIISIALAMSIIYCASFVIRLTENSIEFGTLYRQIIKYDDIATVIYWWVGNSQYVKVKCINGRSKTFERGVKDLDGFAKAIYRRLRGRKVNFEERGVAKFST